MNIRKFLLSLLLACSFLLSNPLPVSHAEATRANKSLNSNTDLSSFSPAACMFNIPSGSVEGRDIECGYLTVPLSHADPEGPSIRLAVAIIRSLDSNPKSDPLVIAQGGPGGSTIDTYVSPLLSPNSRIRADRDIILFDQRGTLYSQPSLYCKEYDQFMLDYLETDLSPDE
jgi:hypothetical protein